MLNDHIQIGAIKFEAQPTSHTRARSLAFIQTDHYYLIFCAIVRFYAFIFITIIILRICLTILLAFMELSDNSSPNWTLFDDADFAFKSD